MNIKLPTILLDFQAEKIDIEEKYANLKEEAVGKSKKLKKVWNMLMSAKSEVCLDHCLLNYLYSLSTSQWIQTCSPFLHSNITIFFLFEESGHEKPDFFTQPAMAGNY